MIDLRFPHLNKAQKIVTTAGYVKQMRPLETHYRYGSVSHIGDAVIPFSEAEKQTIAWYYTLITEKLKHRGAELLPSHINFIKFQKGVEWDCPFTIGTDTIVLSSKVVNEAEQGKTNSHYREQVLEMLVHELVHLHQRREPDKYIHIYTSIFGFIRKSVSLSDDLARRVVTNPDGYNYEWIMAFRLNAEIKFMLPIAVLDAQGRATGVLVELTTFNGKLFYNRDNITIPISAYPLYNRIFGVQEQLYHPNEIIARLISLYLVRGHVYHTENFKSPVVYQAIDDLVN
jgi:hypothetical protein